MNPKYLSHIIVVITLLLSLPAYSQKGTKANPGKKITLSMQLLKCKSNDSIAIYDSQPDIKVVIKNETDTLASFYEDWNAWGHNAMSFELTLNNVVVILHHNYSCDWSKNYPSSRMLFPGDSIIFYYKIIQCTQKTCFCFYNMPKGTVFPKENLAGGKIRAIYQMNPENHKSLIEQENKLKELPGFFLIMGSSHPKQFEKLTAQQKWRSFVQDQLASEPITICVDKW